MIAGKWMDMVIGVDIHYVLVPAPPSPTPIPTPLPHPFTGVVFDPVGLIVAAAISAASSVALGTPFQGPVLVNNMPAANTGTECTNKIVMPHFPMPPGVAWAPIPGGVKPPIPGKPPSPPLPSPVPTNDGIIITGSKTVYFSGNNAARLGSMVMTCAQPVRLPSSTVIAVPMGAPVLVGGPPALDFMATLMGMIRTQWVAGKLHALVSRIRPRRLRNFLHRAVCFFTGHPVDVMTGKVVTDFVDFKLPGYIPFKFERVYYSTSTYEGPLGHGWHHTYDQHIKIEDSYIVLCAEDGREIDFELIDDGQTTRDPIEALELTRIRDQYVLSTKDRLKLYFAPRGRADKNLPIVKIADSNGNEINLLYDNSGHLIEVIDTAGRHIKFINDSLGRLVALNVPNPDGKGSVDVARFEYDENNDLIAAYDALNHAYRYKYKYHLLVQETNRNGFSFYFEYDGIDEDAWCVRTWGDRGFYDHILTYDKEKHITVVENSLGAKTVYYGNEYGLVTKIIDPLGGQKTIEWDEYCRKVTETDQNGNTIRFEYDERGSQTKFIDALNHVSVQRCNELNLPIEFIQANGGKWQRRYDNRGNIMFTQDPLGATWTYISDLRGNIIRIIDALGSEMRLSYDLSGGLSGWTDWEGNTARNQYDYWGRLVRQIDPLGNSYEFSYDLTGRLTSIKYPNGNRREFKFDPEGNLLSVSNADGTSVQFLYDGIGNLIARIDEIGNVVKFHYDTERQLVLIINELGKQYSFEYDPAGNVVNEVSFDGSSYNYVYDPVGNCIRRIDSSGSSVDMRYDANGNILSRKYQDGTETLFYYDELGRLIRISEGSAEVRFERDIMGRIVKEVQPYGEVISEYNKIGNRIRRITSTGHQVGYTYDKNGRLIGLTSGQHYKLSFRRDALGREIERETPSGIFIHEYNSVGQIKRQLFRPHGKSEEILVRTFSYDISGYLTDVQDRNFGETSYKYDKIGRPIELRRPDNREIRVSYQETGTIHRVSRRDGDLESIRDFTYEAGYKLVKMGDITFAYDDQGRIIKKLSTDGAWKYDWDSQGRLGSVITQEGKTWRYRYDPLGRRIAKIGPDGSEQRYYWDGMVICSVQTDGASNQTYIFEPNSFKPLALEKDEILFNFLTDNIDSPRNLYDEEGGEAWSANYNIWEVEVVTKVDGVNCLLRFPGQYYDEETGFHYNWFRYFCPDMGRYLTPDPLGLRFGLDPYSYVTRPQVEIDPFGLWSWNQLEGHHTIPRELMDQMVDRGLLDQGTRQALEPARRTGTVNLRPTPHRQIHQALSDFLNSRHPGLNMRNGFQQASDWARYLDRLESEGRLSLDTVLEEFRSFYHNSLPQRGILTPRQRAAARAAFDHDAEMMKRGCG